MERSRTSKGFTVIELLVVIAVIGILAAILFPILGRVREKGRQATCFSNMHQLYVAASLYKDDWNGYPCLLLGYAERPDGLPWTTDETQPNVPAEQIKHGYLYPTYIKNIEVFHCPDNKVKDRTKITLGEFTVASPIFQELQNTGNGHT